MTREEADALSPEQKASYDLFGKPDYHIKFPNVTHSGHTFTCQLQQRVTWKELASHYRNGRRLVLDGEVEVQQSVDAQRQ